jgi:hypothetical protein
MLQGKGICGTLRTGLLPKKTGKVYEIRMRSKHYIAVLGFREVEFTLVCDFHIYRPLKIIVGY